MPSYSTRTVIRWGGHTRIKTKYLYEERITLWRAKNIDGAIRKSEKEAKRYAKECSGKYLGFVQAYALFDTIDVDGAEVFSLLRESDHPPSQYIDRYFDTGGEKERKS